jgi:hypothetical protein
MNCGVNPPLDPTLPSGAAPCSNVGGPDPACTGTQICGGGQSYENGFVAACGEPCDFNKYPTYGCPVNATTGKQTQACGVAGGADTACLDLMMDKNGQNGNPLLWNYPGVWAQTPFSRGHSSITLAPSGKFPDIGVAQISIPNFLVDPQNPYTTGPYTLSPVAAAAGNTPCGPGYTVSKDKVWCYGNTSNGTGTLASAFTPLTPWFEVQPGVGFPIPLDAQHSQQVETGQLDFTGVLESYIVDYVQYVDPLKSSCVADDTCNAGFSCDSVTHSCFVNDNSIQIAAIEGADFLGQAFLCQDPSTGDILHVGMYDSAISILDWLAAHPGSDPEYPNPQPSAQNACQILVIRSPADNYVDYIVSKGYGVTLNMSGGAGQGRVTDIVLWDTNLIQAL